jgi:hypothetical protein
MAELFPSEGLDLILGVFPKGGTNISSLYVGLFTGYASPSLPASGAALTTVTEMTSGGAYGYTRKLITGAVGWNAQAATPNGDGRRVIATSGQTWTAGANWPAAVNGFFLANSATISGGAAIYYAHFDDGAGVTLNSGDSLTVTPWLGFTV